MMDGGAADGIASELASDVGSRNGVGARLRAMNAVEWFLKVEKGPDDGCRRGRRDRERARSYVKEGGLAVVRRSYHGGFAASLRAPYSVNCAVCRS